MNLLEYQKNLESREIKPLNVIQAQDEYVLKAFIDKLSSLYHVKILWGDELDRKSLLSITESEMFIKKKRVFVIKNAEELFKGVKDGKYFTSLAKKLNNSSIFFVISEKLSKQQLEKEPLKTLLSIGDLLEAKSPDKRKIRELVKNRFVKEGRQIDDSALDYLLEITSYNLMELKNEVDKLILYADERITLEDVKAICISNIEYTVFDFINAFYTKDLEKSLNTLSSLVRWGVPALQIQAVLVNYALKLFVCAYLVENGYDIDKAFSELGITNPYLKHSFKTYLEKFKLKDLKNLIHRLHLLDLSEKIYYADPQESLKDFVVEYLSYERS
ncbi:DNA polymerase III subunit delta [Hydrogenobacter thermophilus]|uniref:DNA polymerase III subunit delta n=1 Tax=Hydrogenobacter thermophilus TaxID=940 RepID=UPI0030F4E7C0